MNSLEDPEKFIRVFHVESRTIILNVINTLSVLIVTPDLDHGLPFANGEFYRIRNKDTENIRGTGLGLWITAQIIKEMKGDISVESIKGVGSHFVLSFPLVD